MKNVIIGATLSLVSLLAVGVGAKEINLTKHSEFQNPMQTAAMQKVATYVNPRTLTNTIGAQALGQPLGVCDLCLQNNEADCAQSQTLDSASPNVSAYGKSMLSFLTPKIIEFYEENIAKTQVISNITSQKRERLVSQLKVSSEKLNAVLLLQDLTARVGSPMDIKAIAAMSEGEMFKIAKNSIEKYISTLSPAEKTDLGAKFEALKKQK